MRRFLKFLAWGFVLSLALVILCGVSVQRSAEKRTFGEVAAVPSGIKVALVLGCSKKLPDRSSNRFFIPFVQVRRVVWDNIYKDAHAGFV